MVLNSAISGHKRGWRKTALNGKDSLPVGVIERRGLVALQPHAVATKCGQFELVVGFSNGHTGTTTLSKSSNYMDGVCQLEDVQFFFEIGKQKGLVKPQTLRSWYHMVNASDIISREEELVRTKYIPHWRDGQNKEKKVAAVLSHDNLYYYRGILRAYSDKSKLLFIRIRRARDELAQSWKRLYRKVPGRFSFGYDPTEHQPVILRPPDGVWKKLSPFQRALWQIDEVESRWQLLVRNEPDLPTLTLKWSKTHDGENSLYEAIQRVALALGLTAPVPPENSKRHVKKSSDENFSEFYCKEQRAYLRAMNYTEEQLGLIQEAYFPKCD